MDHPCSFTNGSAAASILSLTISALPRPSEPSAAAAPGTEVANVREVLTANTLCDLSPCGCREACGLHGQCDTCEKVLTDRIVVRERRATAPALSLVSMIASPLLMSLVFL